MSDPAPHARLTELFHALLGQPPAQREASLAELDPALAERLRRLLDADDQTHDPTAAAINMGRSALLESVSDGMRLGPWRVLRELGAGGMGTVLLAERADGQFQQQVAIKLIRGFPTADGQRRLRQERQILAQLDHPNIARLIDGGQTQDGQPYVVMEYVHGAGLLDHLASTTLDIDARLALFDRIADAVQHAHGRLVIHRDLKPGNVLVQDNGEPKLLDFGVAKLVDVGADSGEQDSSTRIFSRGYASPEQRAGHAVSTATDVYALGVVLREMLTGEREPGVHAPLPQGFVALRIPGDLRGILTRATEDNPAHRYATVEAMRADLARWREGRPVLAAPDSWRYRTGKFIGRHRTGVALLALALLATSGFMWRLAVERSRALDAETAATHALVTAERDSQAARASMEFLARTLAAASPEVAMSTQISVRDLLDQARAGMKDDASLPADARQMVQRLLGNLYQSLGEPQIAAELLEAGIEGVQPATTTEALAFARDLDTLSSLQGTLGHGDKAMGHAQESAALRERFAPNDAAERIRSQAQLAYTHYRRGELEQAHRLWDAILADPPPDAPLDVMLDVYQMSASTWLMQENPERALEISSKGMAYARAHGLTPESLLIVNLARTHAEILGNIGRAGEAVDLLRQTIAVQEQSAGLRGIRAGNLFNALGNALNIQGHYREALEALQRADLLYAPSMTSDVETAASLGNIGNVMESAGDYAGALRNFDAAIVLLEKDAANQAAARKMRRSRARTLGLAGRHEEALEALTTLREEERREEGVDSPSYAITTWQLAVLARQMNDPARGEAWLEEARTRFAAFLGPEHVLFAHVHRLHAAFARMRGDLTVAAGEINEAIARLEALGGIEVDLAIARAERAGINLARGRTAVARRELAQVLPILRQAMLPTEVNRAAAETLARRIGLSASSD
ncbi:MAG TPA: serine/threonine-protein kinase [Chiayiivirga sp.]|nr:serine/threonine-protein kinase [Chiayiivirga sp.]